MSANRKDVAVPAGMQALSGVRRPGRTQSVRPGERARRRHTLVAGRAARPLRRQIRTMSGAIADEWRSMVALARRSLLAIAAAIAQARMVYCDYEGPCALSDVELAEIGISRSDSLALVAGECRSSADHKASPAERPRPR